MKKAIAIAAVAGLAGTAAAQSTGISITASKTSITISESVTFTVTLTNDLPAGAFGQYLASHYLDYTNVGTAGGTASAFNFQHSTTDLNGLGTPRALISNSFLSGADITVHWAVNNLNGDGVNDYIIGATFESPYVLGSFTVHGSAEGFLQYSAANDQDFIDTQGSVDDGVAWGTGTLGLADTTTGFSAFNISSDTVIVTPTPATAALLGLGGLVAVRRRR